MNEAKLINYLKSIDIDYTLVEHPPVFTSEKADIFTKRYPGVGTKNLFLVNNTSNQYYLLMTRVEIKTDLKALGKLLSQKKIKFASTEQTANHLGVEPGAVSIFCLLNDIENTIDVVIDKRLWDHKLIQSHPLVNTATLIVSTKNIEKFIKSTGHKFHIIDLPKK